MNLVKYKDKLLIKLREGYREILISDTIIKPNPKDCTPITIDYFSGEIKEESTIDKYVG